MTETEMIEVMQAYERGEQIEYRDTINDMDWRSCHPIWDWAHVEYRVKPKPTYRPYKDAKEFLKAQEKHGMWLEPNNAPGWYFQPVRAIPAVGIQVLEAGGKLKLHTYESLLEFYHWKDGQKCGIKLPD